MNRRRAAPSIVLGSLSSKDEPHQRGGDLHPSFGAHFRDDFETLLRWRRDVRRFRPEPIPSILLEHALELSQLSPSVGNSQPWRWVRIKEPGRREAVLSNFRRANAEALAELHGERAALYARLKLEGLEIAPEQFAIFCDRGTRQGHGLGCKSMPEMLDYSVACMLSVFWLATRSLGIGMGWVSILDPEELASSLAVPEEWKLIAYICLGWPIEEHLDPELERAGWQGRTTGAPQILHR